MELKQASLNDCCLFFFFNLYRMWYLSVFSILFYLFRKCWLQSTSLKSRAMNSLRHTAWKSEHWRVVMGQSMERWDRRSQRRPMWKGSSGLCMCESVPYHPHLHIVHHLTKHAPISSWSFLYQIQHSKDAIKHCSFVYHRLDGSANTFLEGHSLCT